MLKSNIYFLIPAFLFVREEMKDRMKRLELEKQLEEAVLKVAKQGEPMDPEMLNPARKRPLPKVCYVQLT